MKKLLKIIGGVIGFLVALAILGSCMGGGDSSSNSAKKESKPKYYAEVSVGTLIDAQKPMQQRLNRITMEKILKLSKV